MITFDETDPVLQFTSVKNKGYGDINVNGVNPQDSRFNSVVFSVTPSDNSNASTWTTITVQKNDAAGQKIKNYDEIEEIADGSRPLSYTFVYNGTGNDELCLSSNIRDMAGNTHQYGSVTSDPKRLIKVDFRPPDVNLSFSSTPESETVSGGSAAILSNQNNIQIDFTVTDAFPKSISIELFENDQYSWQPRFRFSKKIDCPLSPEWSGSEKQWNGSIELSTNDFPNDGVYSFRIVTEDYLGNSTASAPATSIGSHNLFWVNKFAPIFTATVLPKVIRKGEKNSLVIDARSDCGDPDASFTYSCDVYLSWMNASGVFQDLPAFTQLDLQITRTQPTLRIQFDHSSLPTQNVGHFRYRIVAKDNVGTTGLQSEQFADFFVETFPPVLSGDFNNPLPKKFHVMGQIGDPDLTNSSTENGFDYYTVYYTSGIETVLPASMSALGSNWKQDGIYVPFHTVDRKKSRAFAYPLSNVADNYQAVTSAWGLAIIFC